MERLDDLKLNQKLDHACSFRIVVSVSLLVNIQQCFSCWFQSCKKFVKTNDVWGRCLKCHWQQLVILAILNMAIYILFPLKTEMLRLQSNKQEYFPTPTLSTINWNQTSEPYLGTYSFFYQFSQIHMGRCVVLISW